MTQPKGFIDTIKEDQPALWELIKLHSQSGLIVVDEENDAISATNRLLWTYPGLHEAINTIINSWNNLSLEKQAQENFSNILKDVHASNSENKSEENSNEEKSE
jgi:hypothetical protein